VWLYLLALPYQLVGVLNWFTIPAVTLASFALLGILGIGWGKFTKYTILSLHIVVEDA
jgi:predicted membrane chloride channel (bestrophin family)